MPATTPLLQEGRYSIEQEFPYLDNCALFQAYDTQNEVPVTIVEVPLLLAKTATLAQREAAAGAFAAQAAKVSGFRHRSIVAVRSHFTESGRNYLVTDPVEGVDLASVLADQNHPFTVAEAAAWADAILDALNAMHNLRPPMVFRNLRPENIVLRADGSVHLLVSGMLLYGPEAFAGASAAGSPLAFAPLEQIWSGLDAASQKVIINNYDEASERILKQDLDARSDIFSLGATLYKLITGRTPVDALERSIEMIEGNADPLVPPNKVEGTIPVEVSDVVMKAMEIRREYRFDSAAIMRQVLKTALVRVKEREAEEALVKKVEGHDVSAVMQNAPAADTAPPSKPSPSPAQAQPKNEPRQPQSGTQPVRKTETFDLADLEDDLLGLMEPSAHSSEAPHTSVAPNVHRTVEPKAEQKPATPEPPKAQEKVSAESPKPEVAAKSSASPAPRNEAKAAPAETSTVVTEKPVTETEAKVESKAEPAVRTKEPAAPAAFTPAEHELFTEQKTRGGIGLPAVAAAAVLLVVAAVGGWFLLGSKAAPAAAVEPVTPAQSAPQQVQEPVQSSLQPAEPEPAGSPASATAEQPLTEPQPQDPEPQGAPEQQQRLGSGPSQKVKKPAPVPGKAPAQKKAVTVDDLINDN